jgi:hypothetical protein
MHKARIIRDKDNSIYLVIKDNKLNVAFRIEEFTSHPSGKQIVLSNEFNINLIEIR